MRRVILGVVLGVLASGCRKPPDAGKPAPAGSVDRKGLEADLPRVTLTAEARTRLGVEVVAIEKKAVPRRRAMGGEVVVPSGGALLLTSPVAATVSAGAAIATLGAVVKRGDPLVSLVPMAPVDRDVRAQAARTASAAEIRLLAAQARLERTEKLLTDGATSARAVEEAKADRDIAKAELQAAHQRRSAMAAQPLAADVTVTVRAPHDGVIRQVGVSRSQNVPAGALLFEVVGTAALWVRVPVFVGEARRVRADAPARVFAFGATESQEALPAHSPALADPLMSTVDFFFELAGTHGFRPGERVQVELAYDDETAVFVAPASAIVRDIEGGTWVYEALADLVFARRRVSLERVEGDVALLAAGVSAQTKIVRVGVAELWGIEFGAGK